MNRILLLLVVTALVATSAFAQNVRVKVSYNQEDISVVIDEKYVGLSPKQLKVDFALASEIFFFKKGFYTHRIEIDPEEEFDKLTITLIPKPKHAKAPVNRIIKPEKLLVTKTVTNMTAGDIQEILDQNFIKNNYFIGKSIDLFPGAESEIKNSRYKIAVEVVGNNQIRSVYKAPRFMMAYIKLRWSLLDVKTNKVVFFDSTDGVYLVKIQSPKGLVISEMMLKVMKGAIKEAQFKLLTNKKFVDLVAND